VIPQRVSTIESWNERGLTTTVNRQAYLLFDECAPEVNQFDVFATTTTSLPSKCEPEVDFFDISTRLPPLPPPSHPNASWRGVFFNFFNGPATTPPPSHSDVSWRWFLVRMPATTPPPSHPNVSWRWISMLAISPKTTQRRRLRTPPSDPLISS